MRLSYQGEESFGVFWSLRLSLGWPGHPPLEDQSAREWGAWGVGEGRWVPWEVTVHRRGTAQGRAPLSKVTGGAQSHPEATLIGVQTLPSGSAAQKQMRVSK